MTKLILLSIVALLISYIGVAVHRMYKVRARYIEDYDAFIGELIEEVSYARHPLTLFIERVKEYKHREFRRTLEELRQNILDNKEITISVKFLRRKEREIIQTCLNGLGRTDTSTQIFNLKNSKLESEAMLMRARQDVRERGELIAKLSILLGIAIIILLI